MTTATASLRGHRAPLFSLSLFTFAFESSPPVSVAVAFDPSWVGTTDPEGGAYGVRQALSPDRTASRTLDPALLTSADPQQWALLLASSQGSNYAESAVAYFNGSSSLVEVIRDWTAAGGLFVQAGRDAAVLGQLFFDFDYAQASAASSSPALATSAVAGTPYAAAAAGLPALAASWEVVGVPDQYCLYSTAADDAAQPCSVVRQSYGAGRVIYLAWDFADAAPDGTQDGAAWVDLLHTAVLADAPSAPLAVSSPSPSPSPSPSAVVSEVSPSPSAAGSEVSPSPSPSYVPSPTSSASPSATPSPLSPTPSPSLSSSPTFHHTPSVALTPSPSPSFNSSSAPSPSATPSAGSSHSPSPSPSHHDDDDDDEEEEDDGPPPFVMDMTWILAVIVLAIVVLVLIAVGVKLYERFSRRRGYDEIPAADLQDHYYDEAEEQQYAHGRV
ncbi:uncharacterized protein ACA1_150700 [Acanthamoeba castellanii str. Neff]|uniref:Uncharacterized protein n=1 Tax=Acanthamoeba castellanii (strain ATCC 30010 / Neff) TaxID=1257118 RepID=L8H209_ACACF|nr:uncharacterized protein ACA1_150700 [Acanthamoeba castellanii str. Neff]ELR18798.1 hypothetical protein ACA1_150700 [Acanthamoeba castellanii str. Neff]